MGMVGGLTQLTPEELERVRGDPKLLPDIVSEMFETDESRTCDLDKAWHGVHFLLVGDAGREEKRWVLPLYLAVSASTFIVSAVFGRLLVINGGAQATSGVLYRVLEPVGIVSFLVFVACGLLWLKGSGMRWLRMVFFQKRIRGQVFVPPDAVRKVMLGGTSLGDIAYYATAGEVRALAPVLGKVTDEELRQRFDVSRMRALRIYQFHDLAQDDVEASFGYVLENFRRAVACYQDAARRGNAVVFSVSV